VSLPKAQAPTFSASCLLNVPEDGLRAMFLYHCSKVVALPNPSTRHRLRLRQCSAQPTLPRRPRRDVAQAEPDAIPHVPTLTPSRTAAQPHR
jgi:hypothetical protein